MKASYSRLNSIFKFLKNPVWGIKTHQHNIFFPDKFTAKRIYKRTFGKKLDLKNPTRLTEKMQWLKLYDRRPMQTICADKIAVRDHVAQKIGKEYLVPIFGIYESADELDLESLPNVPFIIKTNHDSSGGMIVFDKSELNLSEVQMAFRNRLSINYYNVSREWQYKDIRPRILAEQLLVTPNGMPPNDYKIHCFNGRAQFIGVDVKTSDSHHKNYYDPSWNPLGFKWPARRPRGAEVEKPLLLEKVVELAEKLAEDFCYARIDFYIVDNQIYFGEITFHASGGFGCFSPSDWDERWGERLALPK